MILLMHNYISLTVQFIKSPHHVVFLKYDIDTRILFFGAQNIGNMFVYEIKRVQKCFLVMLTGPCKTCKFGSDMREFNRTSKTKNHWVS